MPSESESPDTPTPLTPIDFLVADIQQNAARMPDTTPFTYRDGFLDANDDVIKKIRDIATNASGDDLRKELAALVEQLRIDAIAVTTTLQADETYGSAANPLELRKAFMESGRSLALKLATETIQAALEGADV